MRWFQINFNATFIRFWTRSWVFLVVGINTGTGIGIGIIIGTGIGAWNIHIGNGTFIGTGTGTTVCDGWISSNAEIK